MRGYSSNDDNRPKCNLMLHPSASTRHLSQTNELCHKPRQIYHWIFRILCGSKYKFARDDWYNRKTYNGSNNNYRHIPKKHRSCDHRAIDWKHTVNFIYNNISDIRAILNSVYNVEKQGNHYRIKIKTNKTLNIHKRTRSGNRTRVTGINERQKGKGKIIKIMLFFTPSTAVWRNGTSAHPGSVYQLQSVFV